MVVPPSCPAAQPLLPNSNQPRQNWADSGTPKISQPPNPGLRADESPCTDGPYARTHGQPLHVNGRPRRRHHLHDWDLLLLPRQGAAVGAGRWLVVHGLVHMERRRQAIDDTLRTKWDFECEFLVDFVFVPAHTGLEAIFSWTMCPP